jgi:NTE family protein
MPSIRSAVAILAIALGPAFASDTHALESSAPSPTPEASAAPDRECIGLVLGGGGARGAAHVGVLKVLERERIPICLIAGTSMGAVVGSLYAAGYSADQIEAIMESVDWADVFTDDPVRVELPMRRKEDQLRHLLGFRLGFREGRIMLPRGAIQGQKFMLLLRRLLLPVWDIEDFSKLPIPFKAVATDIETGEAVVFEHGDLAAAVRASLSVPGAFAPVRVDGRLLVDGGLVDNVPVDVARGMGATRLIVVDLTSPLLTGEQLSSPLTVTLQMISVLIDNRTRAALATLDGDDILIHPDMPDISSAAFDRASDAIDAGELAAEAAVAQLQAYATDAESWSVFRSHQARQQRERFDPPLVAFLDVLDNRSRSPVLVESHLDGVVGEPLDIDRLEASIGRAYGFGQFERISWRPVERDGEVGVEVLPVDKGWGPSFITFGLQLSDDFNGRSDYQFTVEGTFTGRNFGGGEWRNRIEIGAIAGFRSEWFQPMGARAEYFVRPYIDYRAEQVPALVDRNIAAEYRVRRAEAGIEAGWTPDPRWQLTAGVFRGYADAERRIGDPQIFTDFSEDFGAVALGFIWDDLDDARFPRRGTRLEVDVEAFRPVLGAPDSNEVANVILDHAIEHGRNRWLLGLRGQSSWGDANPLTRATFLGGFTNLSGYTERELVGTQSLLGRAVYYREFGDATRLFSVPAYIGASLEAGNVWPIREGVSLDSLIYSGSLFVGTVTPFGPVFFGYGYADSGSSSWYLTFGSLLRPRR